MCRFFKAPPALVMSVWPTGIGCRAWDYGQISVKLDRVLRAYIRPSAAVANSFGGYADAAQTKLFRGPADIFLLHKGQKDCQFFQGDFAADHRFRL